MKQPLNCMLLLALSAAGLAEAGPLGTAFTYQGRLDQDGQAANGSYQMTFWLYTGPTGGSPIASNIVSSVAVSEGLFTQTVDFGAGFFDGNERWMSITVATNASSSFTLLEPRTRIAATPYALFASTAGMA